MDIENNTLLIVPSQLKSNIIKKIKIIVNYKIMSLNEFLKKYYFDYDNKTIKYLMDKHKYKYEVATLYINNLYHIENKKYDNKKLDKLVEIKQELLDNKLLYENKLFKEKINNYKIKVIGYDFIESKYKKLLEELNAEFIDNNKLFNNQELYEFKNTDEEIDFIITKIIELKSNNISLNNIKIINNEYKDKIINKLSMYGINTPISINLYGTLIIKLFLDNINNNPIELIKNSIDLTNNFNNKIFNKLINILNEYTFVDNYNLVKDMLIYDFKHTNIVVNYKEQIEFIDLENNIIDESNYVFLPGFNIGIYPITYKDEDYITDNIKELVGLDNTNIKNKKLKEVLINQIKKTNNLMITYKTLEDKEYYVSTLNEELKLIPIKDYKIPYNIKLNNILKLSYKLDLLSKYNYLDKDIDILYNNYKIPYDTYDNKFTGISRKDKLLLSYSSMDNYNKCGFKYYIDNVLRLNIYEEKFANIIGTLFHRVLEESINEDFDFDKSYDQIYEERKFNNKERIFLSKLKDDLKIIIETIKEQSKYISLDKELHEEKIYINKDINITFMGIIDKMLYKEEDGITYVAIIDYKTGNANLNLNNMIYGIDMQLPVYLYLASNTKKLKNVQVIGFYLQKILNNEITIDPKKTYLEQKKDNLKLQGYSIDDTDILSKFDSSYQDSKLIKSLKMTEKGFGYYSKILNKELLDKIIKLVDKKIDETSNNILSNKFDINPKSIKGENISCKYCKYKDLCYKTNKDIVYLTEYKDLEFLND